MVRGTPSHQRAQSSYPPATDSTALWSDLSPGSTATNTSIVPRMLTRGASNLSPALGAVGCGATGGVIYAPLLIPGGCYVLRAYKGCGVLDRGETPSGSVGRCHPLRGCAPEPIPRGLVPISQWPSDCETPSHPPASDTTRRARRPIVLHPSVCLLSRSLRKSPALCT